MSILFSSKHIVLTQSFSKCTNLQKPHRKHLFSTINRLYSKRQSVESTDRKIPFQDVMSNRRGEANRSILVQVQSAQSYKELHSYCSAIGTIKNMFHYTAGVEPLHFIIVEFAQEDDVKSAYQESSYLEDTQVVPVQSPFLWFKAASKRAKLKTSKNVKLQVENGNSIMKDADVMGKLREAENISEQMQHLHKLTKLNEVGTRLRFLAAKQIEMAISGMFPNASALPFGSSVNGCGKMGCDLDLVLSLYNDSQPVKDEGRLVYHCKATPGSERSVSQRHMEAVGDLLQLFLPGCAQVRRILQARVPIIKYYQQLADVECDLSMTNLSGVYMSDFLYLMGSIDERVRPLVFTVRKWAAEVGLTNSSPGRWVTNFSLTLLVLSFLQTKQYSEAVLPSLNQLIKLAGPKDQYITNEGINCTFLRDPNKYLEMHPVTNKGDLKTLLQQFFEYYSQFDFNSKAVCLNESIPITKPEHSAMYIVNPLERGLNVSKNVSLEELEKFKIEVRNAAWILESENIRSLNWGLLGLFVSKRKNNVHNLHAVGINRQPKLIEVSKLFEEDKEDYKNEAVKKEVQNIKRETKQQLKKLENDVFDLNFRKSQR